MAEGLSDKQQAFIDHYVECGFNATEAARRAGYSQATARQQGQRLLTNVDIKAEISRRMDAHAMPANEVIARMGSIARGDMADFVRVDEEEITLSWSLLSVPETKDGEPDEVSAMLDLAAQPNVKPTDRVLHTATVKRASARLDLLTAGQAGNLHLIKKYTVDDKGKITIELYDKKSALDTLAKFHGLLVDKQEVTTITPDKAAQMSTDELEAELKKRGLL